MRIVIDNGSYDMLNWGDIAMLQVAIRRLAALWPQCRITVPTFAPERLAKLCPQVHPLPVSGRWRWYGYRKVLARLGRLVRRPGVSRLAALDVRIWRRGPHLPRALAALTGVRITADESDRLRRFLDAIYAADVVVASGGGYIMDKFAGHAAAVLDTLELGADLGKPTAMFSQGLGPVEDMRLRAAAGRVLSKVDLIALREAREGPLLLRLLGVPSDRMAVTGDDSVQTAYEQRREALGEGIGVNLRMAWYSAVDEAMLEKVGSALQRQSQRYGAPLLAVPISVDPRESDVDTVSRLIGQPQPIRWAAGGPEDVIRQVGRCRMVVTGSYHGAVFALSQGISAVCLTRSRYYADKFLGLADQFGAGCHVVCMQGGNWPGRLIRAMDQAWQEAPRIRSALLKAAVRQIQASRRAYERFYRLAQRRLAG